VAIDLMEEHRLEVIDPKEEHHILVVHHMVVVVDLEEAHHIVGDIDLVEVHHIVGADRISLVVKVAFHIIEGALHISQAIVGIIVGHHT